MTVILALGSAMGSDATVASCDCDPPPATEKYIQDASQEAVVVFVGQVMSITAAKPKQIRRCLERGEVMCHGRRTRFRVQQAWKGVESGSFTLVGSGSNCTYPFEVGREYLVYAGATEPGDAVGASYCGLTRPVVRAKLDLDLLGPPAFEPGPIR